MDLIKSLFAKSNTRGLFTFVFPEAPAGVTNPAYFEAYSGWVYACVRRLAADVSILELQPRRRLG